MCRIKVTLKQNWSILWQESLKRPFLNSPGFTNLLGFYFTFILLTRKKMNFSRRNGCCCMSGIFFALNSINCCCSSVFTICFKQNEISSAIEIQTALIRRKAGTALMPKSFNTFPEETGRFWSKVNLGSNVLYFPKWHFMAPFLPFSNYSFLLYSM